jgi:hypothetical protein
MNLDLLTYDFTKYTFWCREEQRLPASKMFEYLDEHLSHIELMLEEASIDIDDWIDWGAEELRGR